MSLREYRRKRNFQATPEPSGSDRIARTGTLSYVIQKHAASRLHYDFRLEWDGVLKSWAVPKGPSLDPAERRLAAMTEDHPLEYGDFEGIIPEGEYGGGTVLLWDRGTWMPRDDPGEALRTGKLVFTLHGEKLRGAWTLVRLEKRGRSDRDWLLIKRKDEEARTGRPAEITAHAPLSVASGRDLDDVARARGRTWHSNRKATPDRSPDAPVIRRAARASRASGTARVAGSRAAPFPSRRS